MMSNRTQRILIVDDEERFRNALGKVLRKEGYDTILADSGEKALKEIKYIDLAIVDLVMPGMSGITLLKEIKKVRPETKLIIITAYGSYETAQEALRLGVYDYIEKPFDLSRLKSQVSKVLSAEKANPQFSPMEKGKNKTAKAKKEIKIWQRIDQFGGPAILAIGDAALKLKQKLTPVAKESMENLKDTTQAIREGRKKAVDVVKKASDQIRRL